MASFIPLAVGAACAGAAIITGPVVLPLIGFTSTGISAGSAAASFMSFVYTKGVVMTLLSAAQSAGALGTVGFGNIAASGIFGTLFTKAIELAAQR